MTKESVVKKEVKRVLSQYPVYSFWPVQTGFGTRTLDLLGCINGRFFAIETKAPGKKPTAMQENAMRALTAAGATCFVIDSVDDPTFDELKRFLDESKTDHLP